MKFEEAIVHLREGKNIRRSVWNELCFTNKKQLCYLSNEDVFSEDWEVYEEPGKSFNEVFEAFKQGKKIRRKNWGRYTYFYKESGLYFLLSANDIMKTDWEVVE